MARVLVPVLDKQQDLSGCRCHPNHRYRDSLEGADDPASDPAAVKAAGLRNNLLAVDGNRRGHHRDRASDRLEARCGF